MTELTAPITGLYGPDGVGKTTIIEQLVAASPGTVALRATRPEAWSKDYPELAAAGFFDHAIPPIEEFLARADLAVRTAEEIVAAELGRVILDGSLAHRTVANAAIGLVALNGGRLGPENRNSPGRARELMAELLDGPLGQHLGNPNLSHVHVSLPWAVHDVGAELQSRIRSRPKGITSWDPQDERESADQFYANEHLTYLLGQRGLEVTTIISEQPNNEAANA